MNLATSYWRIFLSSATYLASCLTWSLRPLLIITSSSESPCVSFEFRKPLFNSSWSLALSFSSAIFFCMRILTSFSRPLDSLSSSNNSSIYFCWSSMDLSRAKTWILISSLSESNSRIFSFLSLRSRLSLQTVSSSLSIYSWTSSGSSLPSSGALSIYKSNMESPSKFSYWLPDADFSCFSPTSFGGPSTSLASPAAYPGTLAPDFCISFIILRLMFLYFFISILSSSLDKALIFAGPF